MKTQSNCTVCRKNIEQKTREEYLKSQYAIFKDMAFTFAVYATTAALMVQVRRGRSKEYIQRLFDDLVMIYDTPKVFGKTIELTDMKNMLETEYGLDFSRIKVHIEDEKAFVKSVKAK